MVERWHIIWVEKSILLYGCMLDDVDRFCQAKAELNCLMLYGILKLVISLQPQYCGMRLLGTILLKNLNRSYCESSSHANLRETTT